jgi:hypothetical protein
MRLPAAAGWSAWTTDPVCFVRSFRLRGAPARQGPPKTLKARAPKSALFAPIFPIYPKNKVNYPHAAGETDDLTPETLPVFFTLGIVSAKVIIHEMRLSMPRERFAGESNSPA